MCGLVLVASFIENRADVPASYIAVPEMTKDNTLGRGQSGHDA